jgi:hypothetical protein
MAAAVGRDTHLAADDRLDPVRCNDEICLHLVVNHDALGPRADAAHASPLELSASVPCGSQQSIVEDPSRNAIKRAPKRARGGGLGRSQIEKLGRPAVLEDIVVDTEPIKDIKNMC